MVTRELETMTTDRDDGVVTITLRRPERKNAINGRMWIELGEQFREIATSSSDRVLVLTGAGGDFWLSAPFRG